MFCMFKTIEREHFCGVATHSLIRELNKQTNQPTNQPKISMNNNNEEKNQYKHNERKT